MNWSVPAQEQTLEGLGKTASELISPDTSIDFLGNVTGTLKYVDGWKEFSTEPSEQSGHYFPVHLDERYAGKEITCKGKKEKKANDLDWVLFVEGTESTFTFECEGETILTLKFTGATFAQKTIALRQTARRKKSGEG